jgi:hypothetical protein
MSVRRHHAAPAIKMCLACPRACSRRAVTNSPRWEQINPSAFRTSWTASASSPHALIASVMPSEWADLPASDAAARVKIGIETDRGPNAGTSPITRASGTKKTVLARHVRNDRLGDAVHQWVLGALRGSPGARAYYDAMRARNIGHHAALRQLGNRLVGILHGCLKTRAAYNESKAWAHHSPSSS